MTPFQLAVGLLVAILFGGQWIASRFVQAEVPPFAVVVLRLALSALILLPFAPRVPRRLLPRIFVAGSCITSLNLALTYFSVMRLDASTAGTLFQLTTPFTVLFAALLLREGVGPRVWTGIVVAFVGASLITGGVGGGVDPLGAAACIAGAASFAIGSVLVRRWGPFDPIAFNGWSSLFGMFQIAAISVVFEQSRWPELLTASTAVWWAIAFLCLPGGLVAFALWYWLIQRAPVNRAAILLLMTPVTALVGGVALLGETVTSASLGGAALVLAGAAIVLADKART